MGNDKCQTHTFSPSNQWGLIQWLYFGLGFHRVIFRVLGSLIVFYTEQKDYSNAKRYCEKALTLEPDFAWVKNELYPQTLEKIKK